MSSAGIKLTADLPLIARDELADRFGNPFEHLRVFHGQNYEAEIDPVQRHKSLAPLLFAASTPFRAAS
jgi:hypothetical protein